MPEQERKFEGIWIPENIWFCEDLDIIEKCTGITKEQLLQKQSKQKANNMGCQFLQRERFDRWKNCMG